MLRIYVMNRWLRDSAFRIEIEIWIFLLASIIAAAIAVVAVISF